RAAPLPRAGARGAAARLRVQRRLGRRRGSRPRRHAAPMSPSDLSVVVASVNSLPYVEECLASLATACPDTPVIVADSTDDETRRRLADRWPNVRLLSFDSAKTIPELRAAGIFAAQTPYVAVIEDHCVIRNGWANSIVATHRSGHSVVGGPIRNVAPRIRDWAAFLF